MYARIVCFGDQEPKFSQEDLNRIIADEKRKHQQQLSKVQGTLEETLSGQSLTVSERDQLATRLSELEASQRTKEEQLAHERKQAEDAHKRQLSEEKKARETVESRYRESVIEASLKDAANQADAFNPSQIVTFLRAHHRTEQLKDDKGQFTGGVKTVIDFPDTDPAGESVTVPLTPAAAVKRMKELPNLYGNLFKSGIVRAGTPVVNSGKIDVRKLTPTQYAKIRAENPELLGLRRDKRRTV